MIQKFFIAVFSVNILTMPVNLTTNRKAQRNKQVQLLGFPDFANFLCCALISSGVSLSAAGTALTREANNSLNLPINPPSYSYQMVPAFTGLRFIDPVAMATPPGETNRLFIVEKSGLIQLIADLSQPTKTVFLDISDNTRNEGESGALGLAFHPNYAENGYFFVFYSAIEGRSQLHNRLSRFKVDPTNPNRALSESETILFSQEDQASNHNGGDIHFGPDGYLYVSLGDEGGGNDNYNNSQLINKDFFAGILRIDVDERPENLLPNTHPAVRGSYRVPADNPFVGVTRFNNLPVNAESVRTEFWAVGLRNPWRMTFDPATGRLVTGDVGQSAREEINLIEKGGNYGWAFREGTIAGPKAPTRGFSSINPIFEYGRSDGVSVTGGVFYWGNRLPELAGLYIFSDFAHGHIRALRFELDGSVSPLYIGNEQQISAFGIDPSNGDLLTADINDQQIERLVRSATTGGDPIPELLSQVGAFSDAPTMALNPGWLPYEINVPFWSDHAIKSRWFSIPNEEDKIVFTEQGNWEFPTGSVWLKHFELEMIEGDAESRRRLETRFIVRNEGGIYGVTYKWNDEETDAELVAEEGLNETLTIQTAEGGTRLQTWRYPSRTECLACHDQSAGWALGFHTAQLNRDFHYSGGTANQLTALHEAGYFSNPAAPQPNLLAALAPAHDANVSLEHRVRSYLDANCSNCHNPNGLSQGEFDARYETPTTLANLIHGPLNSVGPGGQMELVRPGFAEHSMLLRRLSHRGPGQMPPVGSNELDTMAIDLITEWITTELADYLTYEEWRIQEFGSTDAQQSGPTQDADDDKASNLLEYLTKTDPNDKDDFWSISLHLDAGDLKLQFERLKNRSFQIQYTDNLNTPGDAIWTPWDHHSNRPFFTAENILENLSINLEEAPDRYYRIQIIAP